MKILTSQDTVQVPVSFIENFMDKVSLSEIRVYLLILGANTLDFDADRKSIALRLNMSETGVYAALKSLDDVGLIKFNEEPEEEIFIIPSPIYKKKDAYKDHELLEGAEQVKGSPLTPREAELIFFFKDTFSFSDELILYLLEYAKDRDAFNYVYMKTVAFNWHKKGITSVDKAKRATRVYPKIVYDALSHLGRKNAPTKAEAEYVERWSNTLNMPDDLILYACDLTAINTDKNRLKYASAILDYYKNHGVDSVAKAKSLSLKKKNEPRKNSSNNCLQTEIDFEELEKVLLEN